MMIEWTHWLLFSCLVVGLLVIDLFILHKEHKEPSFKESAFWTAVWFSIAVCFSFVVYLWLGNQAFEEFLTGYVIEWSLSMDNVFIFSVIFTYFKVAKKYQYRVLFWGILGAIIMRLAFIIIGKQAIDLFHWILPLLGLILVISGARLAFEDREQIDPEKNIILRLARRFLPISAKSYDHKFLVREQGKWQLTPLFLVLLVVESTDVIFAIDSIPAIFGVVDQKAQYFSFVVFTSNIFAILGLRALYFMLAGLVEAFKYLHYGLSAILVFVGLKIVLEYVIENFTVSLTGMGISLPEGKLISPPMSLAIVLFILLISIISSVVKRRA